jgi:hypothetical protein
MPSVNDVVSFIRAEADRSETEKGQKILIAVAEALQHEFGAKYATLGAYSESEPQFRPGWRMYCLLALFDTRDGGYIADLVRAAREGYEREDMGEDDAWDEFDTLWHEYSPTERLQLAGRSFGVHSMPSKEEE